MNKYIIKLIEKKLPPYEFIYTLNLLKLKTVKVYIKTHLKIVFIQYSKYLIYTSIIFDKKPNSSLYLSVNY